MASRKGFVMREYTVKEIAQIVGGELIAGDGEITVKEFSTNSKEGDEVTMFVPVIGERVDGHDFIGDAFAHGMRATFTCRKDLAFEQGKNGISGMAYVYVDLLGEKNPNVAALQRFGAYMRKEFSLPVVGITGSTGKTSTKEMVASALETKFCTLKTDGNMNSQVGATHDVKAYRKTSDGSDRDGDEYAGRDGADRARSAPGMCGDYKYQCRAY